MTTTQLLVPIFDLILALPLIMRLFKDFSRFSNATKLKIQSKPEINGLFFFVLKNEKSTLVRGSRA